MASSSEPEPGSAGRRGFVPPRSEAETLLMRRVEELCGIAFRRGIPRCTGFLSDREQDLARAAVNRAGCTFARFWGGWPDAERKVLCLEPPGTRRQEPVTVLGLTWGAAAAAPQHRDVLGAVLGLGLDRAAVGDVLVHSGGAWLFALADKADFIAQNLLSAGHCPVRAAVCGELPAGAMQPPQRTVYETTVPALRADAVLAAMLRAPRSHAAQLISAGRVQVNHLPLRAGHERACAGDIFTVSGVGRYQLQEISGRSRKDRIFIRYFQY